MAFLKLKFFKKIVRLVNRSKIRKISIFFTGKEQINSAFHAEHTNNALICKICIYFFYPEVQADVPFHHFLHSYLDWVLPHAFRFRQLHPLTISFLVADLQAYQWAYT